MSMVIKRFFCQGSAERIESARKLLSELPKSNIEQKIKSLLERNSEVAKKHNLTYTPMTEEEKLKEVLELRYNYKLARINAFETMGNKFKNVTPMEQKTVKDFVPEY